MDKLSKMFKCEKCNYETCDKSNYGRHLASKRHLGENATEPTENTAPTEPKLKTLTPYQIELLQLEKEKLQLKKERDELKQKEKEEKELLKKEKEVQKQKELEEKEEKLQLMKEKALQKQKEKELKEQKDLLRLQKQKEKNEIELKKIQIQKEKLETKKQKEAEIEQKRVNDELAKQIQLEEENKIIDYDDLDFDTIVKETKFNIYKELTTNNINFYSKFINETFKINKYKCVRVDKTLQLYRKGEVYIPKTNEELAQYSLTGNTKELVNNANSLKETYIRCEIYRNNEWIDNIGGEPITVEDIYYKFVSMFNEYKEYDNHQHLFERADSDNMTNTNRMTKMKYIARILREGSNYFENKMEEDRISKERYNDTILQRRDEQESKERQYREDRDKMIERQRKEQEKEDKQFELEAKLEKQNLKELRKEVKAERRRQRRQKQNENYTDTESESESEEENEIVEFV